MTIADLQDLLLRGAWTLVRRDALVRTLVENGSQQLLTLAGEDGDVIPDLTLNDIRWLTNTL